MITYIYIYDYICVCCVAVCYITYFYMRAHTHTLCTNRIEKHYDAGMCWNCGRSLVETWKTHHVINSQDSKTFQGTC